MKQYLSTLSYIMDCGDDEPTRAVLKSTGKNVNARSVWAYQKQFSEGPSLLSNFPAVTTKKLFWKGVVAELLWFLAGDTNAHTLQEQGVHIWDQWCGEDGELGPVYGHAWRKWDGHVDQISNLVADIREKIENPFASCGRRMILTAWNPPDISRMGLPPCHYASQYKVKDGRLNALVHMRSCDAFLGFPFNLASYALLTSMLAHVTGLTPGSLHFSFGDLHIYENHFDQVREQMKRTPIKAPTLALDPDVKDIFAFLPEHISLEGYESHPAIKAEVAV